MCDLTGFGPSESGFGERPPLSYPATGRWEVRSWYYSNAERDLLVLVSPDGTTDMESTFDSGGVGFSMAHDECDDRNSEARP